MSKKKLIIISAVALILIIIAIVCIVMFTGDKKETQEPQTQEKTTEQEEESSTEQKEIETKETETTSEIESTEETTIKETITEAPTEAPTIEKEPEVKKDYEIVWSSNPYFFTKKFSDGTEKYYFTYRANIEMSGKETTAIGVIPPEEIPYLDYEPDYYLSGQTGNPYADSTQDESTEQQTSGNTGSTTTEQETISGTTPHLVTIDGVQYMMNSDGTLIKLGGGSVSEEEQQKFEEWCKEHGVSMSN